MENSNLWDAEWDITEKAASEIINSQFPQLTSKAVKKLGYGWDNTVFLIGDEYVFRFPRRKVAINSLNMERRILPVLEEFIPIPYSKPLFFGVGNNDYPAPFLGYPYLHGKFPMGLTEEQRVLSVKELAHFLKSLHSFPIQKAQEYGIQNDHRNLTDISQRKQKMYTFISKLDSYLDEKELCTIHKYLDGLVIDRVEPKYVFLHGDLHFKNILVDERGLVSGIIDWGDMNIGHPACDLSVGYSFFPPHARPDFFEQYGGVDEETKILARLIAVYIPMLILMQAVADGDNTAAAESKATIVRALSD